MSRNNVIGQYAPLSKSAEHLSPIGRPGLVWNQKLGASSGAFSRLRRCLCGIFVSVFNDLECLEQICEIGEAKPSIQLWMKAF